MTPREKAEGIVNEFNLGIRLPSGYSGEIATAIAEAIIAAVEEDRKTRPHVFVGARDRWCEVCNEPDRDPRHLPSREMLLNSVAFAVEAERRRTHGW